MLREVRNERLTFEVGSSHGMFQRSNFRRLGCDTQNRHPGPAPGDSESSSGASESRCRPQLLPTGTTSNVGTRSHSGCKCRRRSRSLRTNLYSQVTVTGHASGPGRATGGPCQVTACRVLTRIRDRGRPRHACPRRMGSRTAA
jgi:hypothetical protein